ncbi:unnamed protein product [Ixodes hexagonus]
MIEGVPDIVNSEPGHEDRLAAERTRESLDSERDSNLGSFQHATEVQDAGLDSQQDHPKARRQGRGKVPPVVPSTSQPCRFFAKHGHCRYGDRCRYPHDVSGLSDAETVEGKHAAKRELSSAAAPTEMCRFYERTGYCRFGRSCRYVHRPRRRTKNGQGVDKTALKCRPVEVADPNCTQGIPATAVVIPAHAQVEDVAPKASDADLTCHSNEVVGSKSQQQLLSSTRVPAQNVSSPNLSDQGPKGELTEEEMLKESRAREIEQFRRRYRRCRKIAAANEENAEKFSFLFQPTDPDWPFDVKELSLLVSFPQSYPKECFTLQVLDEEAVLPSTLLRDLNRAVSSWLLEKHATNERLGQTQLILRPFLRWFDRNLEELFIEGLRKVVKKMQLAEAAGLEFVPFEHLALKVDGEQPETIGGMDAVPIESEDARGVKPSTCNGFAQHIDAEAPSGVVCNGLLRGFSEAKESDPTQVVSQDGGHDDSAKIEKTRDCRTGCSIEAKGSDPIQAVSQDKGHNDSAKIEENTRNRKAEEQLGNTGVHKSDEKGKQDDSAKSEQPDAQRPRADILVNQKRGTEVKFRRLELGESVATLECLKVALRIQCSRCRCNADLTTPPRRRNVVTCGRCSQSGALTFRPNLMHAFNSVVGYLDLTDYQVVDLVLSGCIFAVECFGCNRRISTDGIHYGQRRSIWCQFCNAKMVVLMESIKFQQLQPAKAAGNFTVKMSKAVKNVKDPAIQEGKPLPAGGICKHYKKSFRWLRFPCCGKAYPCDKCHEEQEGSHEMKFATRMICGHCAKEQPFAAEKPCVACGSFMTKKPTAHWEGGRGCRDSIKMSRDDNKKYSGIGKTISRKAQDKNRSAVEKCEDAGIWGWLGSLATSMSGIPPSVQRLRSLHMDWHFAVGGEGKVLAILQDQSVEIRSSRDEYVTVIGRGSVPKDPVPQWRRVAWSPDCSFLAVALSTGRIEFFDTVGSSLFYVPEPLAQMDGVLQDLSYAIAGMVFTEARVHKTQWSYELLAVNYRGQLKSYLLSPSDGYRDNHSFHLGSFYPKGVTCLEYHPSHQVLLVAGRAPAPQSDSGVRSSALELGITAWRFLSDYPHYKLVTSLAEDAQVRLCIGFQDSTHLEIMPKTRCNILQQYLKNKLAGDSRTQNGTNTTQRDIVLCSSPSVSSSLGFYCHVIYCRIICTCMYGCILYRYWINPIKSEKHSRVKKFLIQIYPRNSKFFGLPAADLSLYFLGSSSNFCDSPLFLCKLSFVGVTKNAAEHLTIKMRTLIMGLWMQRSLQFFQLKLYKNKEDTAYRLSISPSGTVMAAAHTSGALSFWSLPALLHIRTWQLEELPKFNDLNPQILEPGRRKYVALRSESTQFSICDMNWWSDEALIVAHHSGAVKVVSLSSKRNLLGESPEWFEFSPQVSGVFDRGFLTLECEWQFAGKKPAALIPADDAESSDEEVAPASLAAKAGSLVKHAMYYVTDSQRFAPPRKKPKFITKFYRLLCVKSTTPEELFAAKIDAEEYGEALALARTYGLDSDLVYQRQWRRSTASVAAIQDYLSKITKRTWVLHECLERVPNSLKAARELLEFGLRGTDVEAVATAGESTDEGRFIANSTPFYEDIYGHEHLTEVQQAQKRKKAEWEWRQKWLAKIDFANLTLDQRWLCECRLKLLAYLDRLAMYEESLGTPIPVGSAWLHPVRVDNAVGGATDVTGSNPHTAIYSRMTFAGLENFFGTVAAAASLLTALSERPPLLGLFHCLPRHGAKPSVLLWHQQKLREKDWVEENIPEAPMVAVWDTFNRDFYDDNPSLKKWWTDDLTPEMLTQWYSERARQIEEMSSLVENALDITKLGCIKRVEGLEKLYGDLLTLATLVYDCHLTNAVPLARLEEMSDAEKMRLLMSMSTKEKFVLCIHDWLLPFVDRCETVTPGSRRKLLSEFLTEVARDDLVPCVDVFEHSNPDDPVCVLDGTLELAELALACICSCQRNDQLDCVVRILKCVPQRGVGGNESDELKHLHDRLDTLEKHVEVAECMQRYGAKVSVKALADCGDDRERLGQLLNKMALSAVKRCPALNEMEWSSFLDDILQFQQSTFKSVEPTDCVKIVARALLCSGNKDFLAPASRLLTCSRYSSKQTSPKTKFSTRLSHETSVELVLSAAREYVDSAASHSDPSITLARRLLQLEERLKKRPALARTRVFSTICDPFLEVPAKKRARPARHALRASPRSPRSPRSPPSQSGRTRRHIVWQTRRSRRSRSYLAPQILSAPRCYILITRARGRAHSRTRGTPQPIIGVGYLSGVAHLQGFYDNLHDVKYLQMFNCGCNTLSKSPKSYHFNETKYINAISKRLQSLQKLLAFSLCYCPEPTVEGLLKATQLLELQEIYQRLDLPAEDWFNDGKDTVSLGRSVVRESGLVSPLSLQSKEEREVWNWCYIAQNGTDKGNVAGRSHTFRLRQKAVKQLLNPKPSTSATNYTRNLSQEKQAAQGTKKGRGGPHLHFHCIPRLSRRRSVPLYFYLLSRKIPGEDVAHFQGWSTCRSSLSAGKVALLSRSNGFVYPNIPDHLTPLDCITEHLVSPRNPVMQICRLRHITGHYGVIGQDQTFVGGFAASEADSKVLSSHGSGDSVKSDGGRDHPWDFVGYTAGTTRSVLTTLGSAEFWKGTVRNLTNVKPQKISEEKVSVTCSNHELKHLAVPAFYESLHKAAYLGKYEPSYEQYDLPKWTTVLTDLLNILRASAISESVSETSQSTDNSQETRASVLLGLSRGLFFEDSLLAMCCLFAVAQMDQAEEVFVNLPSTPVVLGLASYFFSLAALVTSQVADVDDLLQKDVADIVEEASRLDTGKAPEKVVHCARLAAKFRRLQADLGQAELLRKQGGSVDVARFAEDDRYKAETILGMALTSDREALRVAVSLARSYDIPLWDVYSCHLEFLFLEGCGVADIEERLCSDGMLDVLLGNPSGFRDLLTDRIFPSLDGSDHGVMVFFYSLLENCAPGLPSGGDLSPVEHLKLLGKLRKACPGVDYKALVSSECSPLEVLGPFLKKNNVDAIVNAPAPCNDEGRLSSSTIYSLWATKLFLSRAQERAMTTVEWAKHFETCKTFLNRLSPSHLVKFVESTAFHKSAIECVSRRIRLDVVKQCLKLAKQSQGSSPDEKQRWSDAAQMLQRYLTHLQRVDDGVFGEAAMDLEDPVVQGYATEFELSMGLPDKLESMLLRCAMSEHRPGLLPSLLSCCPPNTVDKQPTDIYSDAILLASEQLRDPSKRFHPVFETMTPEDVLERILHQVLEEGEEVFVADMALDLLRPFCLDTNVAIQVRLKVLEILEKSVALSAEDESLLLLLRVQTLVWSEWPDYEVHESLELDDDTMQTMFDELVERCATTSSCIVLGKLLQCGTPLESASQMDPSKNPWCRLLCKLFEVGIGQRDTLDAAVSLFSSAVTNCSLGVKCCRQILEGFRRKGSVLHMLRAAFGTSHKEIHKDAISYLQALSDVSESDYDENLLDRILVLNLLPKMTSAPLYEPLVAHLLANQDPAVKHFNVDLAVRSLLDVDKAAEAGTLLLQCRRVHPALSTFSAALKAARQWVGRTDT